MNTKEQIELYENFISLKNEMKEKEKQLETLKKQVTKLAPTNGSIFQNGNNSISVSFVPKYEFDLQLCENQKYTSIYKSEFEAKEKRNLAIQAAKDQYQTQIHFEESKKEMESDFFKELKKLCIEENKCITQIWHTLQYNGLQLKELKPSFTISVEKIKSNNDTNEYETKYYYKK